MVTQPSLPFDVCAGRHCGSPQSKAANPARHSKSQTHARILALMGSRRMTSKEIAAEMGVGLNCISGRLSEMRALGLIEKTGQTREGAAVVRMVL